MNEEIPHFEESGEFKMVPGKPIIEREMALSFVYNPKTDMVLCLKWNSYAWKTFVNGGVDDGEDLETTGRREIQEETGYMNVKFLGESGKAKSSFYAANKGENRISNATALVFELIDEEMTETGDEEKEKHLPEWVKVDDVANYVNIDWQLYLWESVLAFGLINRG